MDPPDWTGAVQGSLFPNKVVAMPNRSGLPRTGPRTKAAGSGTGTRPPAKRLSHAAVEGQGQLDFLSPAPPKSKTLGTTVEAMVNCEAPVATPLHRALAGIIDWALVLIGFGLFLTTFAVCGGDFVLTRPNLLIFGSVLALIACTYGLFWTVAGTETAGMRWTRLRLVTFHGFPPDAAQRFARLGGSCLSLLSVLGILWCMADEEGLGWQDHISGTFPTADDAESRVFRRQ